MAAHVFLPHSWLLLLYSNGCLLFDTLDPLSDMIKATVLVEEENSFSVSIREV